MNACEEFLLAGLRREIGPHGDLQAAYRKWYASGWKSTIASVIHMLEELDRREGKHAG